MTGFGTARDDTEFRSGRHPPVYFRVLKSVGPTVSRLITVLTLGTVAFCSACQRDTGAGGETSEATPAVQEANAQFAKDLPLEDQKDFEDAARGLVAKASGKITAEEMAAGLGAAFMLQQG